MLAHTFRTGEYPIVLRTRYWTQALTTIALLAPLAPTLLRSPHSTPNGADMPANKLNDAEIEEALAGPRGMDPRGR